MYSTDGIGIHADSFESMRGHARWNMTLHQDPVAYQALRRQSLERFNSALRWEIQEGCLRAEYQRLVAARS